MSSIGSIVKKILNKIGIKTCPIQVIKSNWPSIIYWNNDGAKSSRPVNIKNQVLTIECQYIFAMEIRYREEEICRIINSLFDDKMVDSVIVRSIYNPIDEYDNDL